MKTTNLSLIKISLLLSWSTWNFFHFIIPTLAVNKTPLDENWNYLPHTVFSFRITLFLSDDASSAGWSSTKGRHTIAQLVKRLLSLLYTMPLALTKRTIVKGSFFLVLRLVGDKKRNEFMEVVRCLWLYVNCFVETSQCESLMDLSWTMCKNGGCAKHFFFSSTCSNFIKANIVLLRLHEFKECL